MTQSVSTYAMSCFEFPNHFYDGLQQVMARFWWGAKADERKIHRLSWEKMCSPKSKGRLGFRHMKAFNLSMLAKIKPKYNNKLTMPKHHKTFLFYGCWLFMSNFIILKADLNTKFVAFFLMRRHLFLLNLLRRKWLDCWPTSVSSPWKELNLKLFLNLA